MKCYECGMVFDNPNRVDLGYGEIVACCPSCEGAYEMVEQCLMCGEYLPPDELLGGFCEDCFKEAEREGIVYE